MAEEARSRLGRGLASLIGDVGGEAAHLDRPRAQRKVPIEFLKPNPRNPRRDFSDTELGELADSIKEHGVIQPIVVRPVHGVVTSTFGVRDSPYGDGREMHPGIDIQAPFGEPVAAGGAGEVIYAGRDAGYGRLVVVDHGGDLETLYGHLSKISVREGQRVNRGQELGAVGASGRATGAHLHYEVRQNDEPVN